MTKTNYYVHPSSYIDAGAQIGEGAKIWHFSHIMGGAILGDQCNVGQNVFIADQVILGKNVKVQNNVSIYQGVIVEDDVFLGPSMVFTNVYNPRSAVNRKDEYRSTLVKKGASVGANATVVCGVTIGAYAFVGAGAVVKSDVPDYAIVVGVPGVIKGWMSEHGETLTFGSDGLAICSATSERYELTSGMVKKLGPV